MLIQPYQKTWTNDFKNIKNILEAALNGLNIQIEHVGSTSVQDLPAKAIIDIDIVFDNFDDFELVKQRLKSLDYYHNGDQGISGREVFKRNKNATQHKTLDTIKHHLYVCHISNAELKRHLAFRDYLRKNQTARAEYTTLKYKIAELANQDRKIYAQLKETMAKEFIESALQNQVTNSFLKKHQ